MRAIFGKFFKLPEHIGSKNRGSEQMNKKKLVVRVTWLVFFLTAMCFTITPADAEFQYEKTYDKSNYQEIADLLTRNKLKLIKDGDLVIRTKKLEFELKADKTYLQLSERNEGIYDVTPDGIMIEKASGNPVEDFKGYSFPNPDPKDPKFCMKVMHNFVSIRCYWSATGPSVNDTYFTGDGGIEKMTTAYLSAIYYPNRKLGPIPNPSGMIQQSIVNIIFPYDLRGTVQMSWIYLDDRQDTCFAYVPMLRRIRRVSAASRSDPFAGGDSCVDDAYGYYGKVADMTYQYLGEKTILHPFLTVKTEVRKCDPDGSVVRPYWDCRMAAENPQTRQAPWVIDEDKLVWAPMPVYVIEMEARDPYYNYGKQHVYINRNSYEIHSKDIYDKAGEFWKGYNSFSGNWVAVHPDGTETKMLCQADMSGGYDPKLRHSTIGMNVLRAGMACRYFIPIDQQNQNNFTTAEMLKLSK